MTLNPSETRAKRFFESLGYNVDRIAEGPAETADFHVTKVAESYVVEVTGRGDQGKFDEDLERLGKAIEARVAKPNAPTDKILREKNSQIRSTSVEGFGVVWIELQGQFADPIAAEIKATFLGHVGIAVRGGGKTVEKPCYYFDHASCFRRTNINAVIVFSGDGLQVLFNEHAHRAAEFRTTPLILELEPGLIVPSEEVAAGEAFTLEDFDGDRMTDIADRKRRALLEKKYGLLIPVALRWNNVTVGVRVPLAGSSDD